MNRTLFMEKLERVRELMITGRYMMLLFTVTAVFAIFEWNVLGVLVLACIVGVTLVICDDLLATFMPFMLVCLVASKCYNSYSIFIQYVPLGIVLIVCLILHFVLYRKKLSFKGSLTGSMLFVSVAVTLGGIGFISKEEYFSGVSLFNIFALGFGMVLLYGIFYTHLTVRKSYSLIEKVTLIMVIDLHKHKIPRLLFPSVLCNEGASHIFRRHIHACQIQNRRRQVDKAYQPFVMSAALERPAADDKRRMRTAVMAASLILHIACFKV